jgi:hypothetical protein
VSPLDYHLRGWRIVPIPAGQKQPDVTRGWPGFPMTGNPKTGKKWPLSPPRAFGRVSRCRHHSGMVRALARSAAGDCDQRPVWRRRARHRPAGEAERPRFASGSRHRGSPQDPERAHTARRLPPAVRPAGGFREDDRRRARSWARCSGRRRLTDPAARARPQLGSNPGSRLAARTDAGVWMAIPGGMTLDDARELMSYGIPRDRRCADV